MSVWCRSSDRRYSVAVSVQRTTSGRRQNLITFHLKSACALIPLFALIQSIHLNVYLCVSVCTRTNASVLNSVNGQSVAAPVAEEHRSSRFLSTQKEFAVILTFWSRTGEWKTKWTKSSAPDVIRTDKNRKFKRREKKTFNRTWASIWFHKCYGRFSPRRRDENVWNEIAYQSQWQWMRCRWDHTTCDKRKSRRSRKHHHSHNGFDHIVFAADWKVRSFQFNSNHFPFANLCVQFHRGVLESNFIVNALAWTNSWLAVIENQRFEKNCTTAHYRMNEMGCCCTVECLFGPVLWCWWWLQTAWMGRVINIPGISLFFVWIWGQAGDCLRSAMRPYVFIDRRASWA